jgi:uncharacterized protein DUF222
MSAALDLHPDAGHPAVAAAFEVHALLDSVDLDALASMSPSEATTAVSEWSRAVSRVEAVRLKMVAAADKARVAEADGLTGTDAWLTRQTRSGREKAGRDLRLATELDRGHDRTGAALHSGEISAEHAAVIVAAADKLPARLSEEARSRVEAALVEQARRLDPGQLRRAARRALAAVEPDPDVVDAHQGALLRAEEAAAYDRSRLTLHDNDDGTTTGHFTVPTAAGSMLRKIIEKMTAPRRARLGANAAQAGTTADRFDWAARAGQAFVELLEHLPTDHLHSRTAVTVVATIDQDKLTRDLGAAALDTGVDLSAGDLRRLACAAQILPAVLDGASRVLDLGRGQRLFNGSQDLAVSVNHATCAADGCERPVAWCELHHRHAWARGGATDLSEAVPLCGFHHRRIHDQRYHHRYGPGGIVTFTQRT